MSTTFNKYWIAIMSILAVCFIAGCVLLAVKMIKHRPTEIILNSSRSTDYQIEVYIDGAVANPGIYPASKDDSIHNLIEAAGVLTDSNNVYLKLHISDTDSINAPKIQRVNINQAEVWLLEALPGIGQSKAQAIVDYRSKNGMFRRIEDLLKVNGISKVTLDNIRTLITVED